MDEKALSVFVQFQKTDSLTVGVNLTSASIRVNPHCPWLKPAPSLVKTRTAPG